MPYNRENIESIALYAKQLEGKTFLEVLLLQDLHKDIFDKIVTTYSNPRHKGGLGNFLEEIYFGYKTNSDRRADFHEAGVELKVSPYELTKKNEHRAGERLVLTMIDYNSPVEEELFTSHLWDKIKKILLVYYFRGGSIDNKLQYRIDYTGLFTPNEEDLAIIEADYKTIISKIESGKAHELSESDTLYLSACTKGATAEKSLSTQFYNTEVKAKKRAFAFKQSYMHTVLQELVCHISTQPESIIHSSEELKHSTFEMFILDKLQQHYGKSDKELCALFDRAYNCNKAQWTDLTYRMLGIKSNKALEFAKANIVVKSIRIEEDGTMKESLSFPTFRFMEIIFEEWDNSSVFNYFDETKFLFAVYKRKGDNYIFIGAKFWNMPAVDLEGDVKTCWLNTIDIIRKGVSFVKSGKRIFNNLPSSKDNRIMHVRPHAAKSAYKLNDGTMIGNIESNADELPDGQWMTRQCFWLNNSYVVNEVLRDII